MESRKRPKSNKGQDLISNLPDVIIGQILSLIPTRDAVRTSVLSKNWKDRWTLITHLHFDDRGRFSNRIVRRNSFLSFVYRVLFHLNSSSIQSFSLHMTEMYEPWHVDLWISVVLSRRVKKLCVNLRNRVALSSHSLLKYKSLEQLVFNGRCYCNITVPPFACFSSLTVLELFEIKFIGDTCNESGKIHIDFPLLRKYKTVNCTWSSSLKYVTLEVPLLEVVSINETSRPASASASYPAMKFCASRLTELTYSGFPLPGNNLFDLSAAHIASADIVMHGEENSQHMMALCSKILKQFKNVECLKFQKLHKVLLEKDSLADLPSFEMLSHLEIGDITGEILLALVLKTPYLKTLIFRNLLQHDPEQVMLDLPSLKMLSHLELEEVTDEILLAFLLKTPCLKTLCFKRLRQRGQELLNYDRVPECLLSTLQVVQFGSLDGSAYQLNFAKFVIENAVALKTMSFKRSCNAYGSYLVEVKVKLYSLKRSSSSLSFEF